MKLVRLESCHLVAALILVIAVNTGNSQLDQDGDRAGYSDKGLSRYNPMIEPLRKRGNSRDWARPGIISTADLRYDEERPAPSLPKHIGEKLFVRGQKWRDDHHFDELPHSPPEQDFEKYPEWRNLIDESVEEVPLSKWESLKRKQTWRYDHYGDEEYNSPADDDVGDSRGFLTNIATGLLGKGAEKYTKAIEGVATGIANSVAPGLMSGLEQAGQAVGLINKTEEEAPAEGQASPVAAGGPTSPYVQIIYQGLGPNQAAVAAPMAASAPAAPAPAPVAQTRAIAVYTRKIKKYKAEIRKLKRKLRRMEKSKGGAKDYLENQSKLVENATRLTKDDVIKK
jgi:hypothetical protein